MACLEIKFYWHTAPPFVYVLSKAACSYNGRNESFGQRLTIWLAKSKYALSGSLQKKFAFPCFINIVFQRCFRKQKDVLVR